MKFILVVIVLWLIWKYAPFFDGIKAKMKEKKEITEKETAERKAKEEKEAAERKAKEEKEAAERKAKEEIERKEKEEKERKKKIANCEHEYSPLIYDGYKDQLFREIDSNGHSFEKCSKCENIIIGDVIAEVNCAEIPKSLSTDILFPFRGDVLNVGEYSLIVDEIHYLVANKNWPSLDIAKGEVLLSLILKGDLEKKNDEYPVGIESEHHIFFRDEEGNIIHDDNMMTARISTLSEYELAYELYDKTLSSLDYDQIHEVFTKLSMNQSVLLKVPSRSCKLAIGAFFPQEEEQ